MKKIRYLPFGYTIRNGQTVIDQQEAETVRGIFTAYIHGASLKEIAEDLTAKNIPYTERSCVWDKARISRILKTPNTPAMLNLTRSLRKLSTRKPSQSKAHGAGIRPLQNVKESGSSATISAAEIAARPCSDTSTPSGLFGKAGRAAAPPAACGCESAMVNCSKRSRCL